MIEAVVYIALCVLTGFYGSERLLGLLGTFLLALIVTPFVVLPVLFLTGPSRKFEWRRRE